MMPAINIFWLLQDESFTQILNDWGKSSLRSQHGETSNSYFSAPASWHTSDYHTKKPLFQKLEIGCLCQKYLI